MRSARRRRVSCGDRLGRAGDDRNADAVGRLARRGLVAHHLDRVGGRADEREPGLGHGAREVGAFGQEPVPGWTIVALAFDAASRIAPRER